MFYYRDEPNHSCIAYLSESMRALEAENTMLKVQMVAENAAHTDELASLRKDTLSLLLPLQQDLEKRTLWKQTMRTQFPAVRLHVRNFPPLQGIQDRLAYSNWYSGAGEKKDGSPQDKYCRSYWRRWRKPESWSLDRFDKSDSFEIFTHPERNEYDRRISYTWPCCSESGPDKEKALGFF